MVHRYKNSKSKTNLKTRINYLLLISCLFGLGLTTQVNGQKISASGGLGLSIPQDQSSRGGINLEAGPSTELNVLYHHNDNFGIGIVHTSSYHTRAGRRGLGFKDYRLRFTGLKAQYEFRYKEFKPYAALSIGVKRLRTPKVEYLDSDGNITRTEQFNANAIGVVPEVGLIYKSFFFSTQYSVPTIFEAIENTSRGLLGSVDIRLGYRYVLELKR